MCRSATDGVDFVTEPCETTQVDPCSVERKVDCVTESSDNYEKFIHKLITAVKDSGRKITDLAYGGQNRIQGICGQHHQIDVSFVDHDLPKATLVLIECKQRGKKRIDLEHVKVLKATLDDIKADTANDVQAMIVTTIGAREGAQRFADFYEIKIEVVSNEQNFTFRYDNQIKAGISLSMRAQVIANPTVKRICESCGLEFEVQANESLCTQCS